MKRLVFLFAVFLIVTLVSACGAEATATEAPAPEASPVPTDTAAPAPTALPSATPTASPLIITINIDFAYLRSGPNVDYQIISDAYIRGTQMELLSVYKDWFYVKAPDQKIGWLYLAWVNLNTIEVASVPTPSFLPDPPLRPTPKPTNAGYPNP